MSANSTPNSTSLSRGDVAEAVPIVLLVSLFMQRQHSGIARFEQPQLRPFTALVDTGMFKESDATIRHFTFHIPHSTFSDALSPRLP
jgi:hypothetical protein